MSKITFDQVVSAVAQGATIGQCADMWLNGVMIGYPADCVNPEHNGHREVYQFPEEGDGVVKVPFLAL